MLLQKILRITQQQNIELGTDLEFSFSLVLDKKILALSQIQGVPYRVRLKPNQLYPIMDDPAGLSSKLRATKLDGRKYSRVCGKDARSTKVFKY